MTKRLIAIAFIFICTAVAWAVLGSTILVRSRSSDQHLRGRVSSTWGTPQSQQAPTAYTERTESRLVTASPPSRRPAPPGTTTTTDVAAAPRTEVVRIQSPLALEQTRATVSFDLDHRQKGLLWYSTYAVDFNGAYRFRNTTDSDSVTLEFRLPAAQAIYDNLKVLVNGAPATYRTQNQSLATDVRVARGDTVNFSVAYRSQGLDEWRYVLGTEVTEVRDFDLAMRTNFGDIDFPESTLSPTEKVESDGGWALRWTYANLISGFQIGMAMPQKLQPGPLAGEIAYFAPVSLLFFFAVMFIIVTLRGIDLHPMNYAFIAAGFFAFHLLLAYLVDHISIHVAFIIASAVSIGLVVSYLRLAVGPSFAFREAAAAQFIYLVLFSYAFFFKGFTGLAITIGSIITLFVAMQLTGRIRWSEVFAESQRRFS
ncbi:MAG TPA: inner membrane CreD family protein [Gemmatimonadaceae bacterium]|nr:inner membrane CreD family protein [Gemmatimonadaceae bacterium]